MKKENKWNIGMPPCSGYYDVDGLVNCPVYLWVFRPGEIRGIVKDTINWGYNKYDDPESIELDCDITPQNIRWRRLDG